MCTDCLIRACLLIKQIAKVVHRTKILAMHSQLAFEGKGVRLKSVVTLRGAHISPQNKTKNKQKCKYCFWENEMNAVADTDKQTNLIHKYILYISALNHGPISANEHV